MKNSYITTFFVYEFLETLVASKCNIINHVSFKVHSPKIQTTLLHDNSIYNFNISWSILCYSPFDIR